VHQILIFDEVIAICSSKILLLTRELADQQKATKKKKGSNDPRVTLTPSTDQYSIRASFDSSIATLAKPVERLLCTCLILKMV
jgi:hypothetical protein